MFNGLRKAETGQAHIDPKAKIRVWRCLFNWEWNLGFVWKRRHVHWVRLLRLPIPWAFSPATNSSSRSLSSLRWYEPSVLETWFVLMPYVLISCLFTNCMFDLSFKLNLCYCEVVEKEGEEWLPSFGRWRRGGERDA